MPLFSYLFWPNPGNAHYSDPNMVLLLAVGLALAVASLGLRAWRAGLADHRMKKLSGGWQTASLWFGVTLLFLVVCRVETIQFLAMRALIFIWGIAFLTYVVWQVRRFRKQYFQIVPRKATEDAREKYLPKKKHR